MREILASNPAGPFNKRFISRAREYGLVPGGSGKVTPCKYFIAAVANHLWMTWQTSQLQEHKDRLVIYAQLIVYGKLAHVAVKYPQEYEDIYQTCMLHVIRALPNYNCKRGSLYSLIYTRCYWDSIGESAKHVSYAAHNEQLSDEASDLLSVEVEVESCA